MNLRGKERQEFPLRIRKLAFVRCCRNGSKPGIPQCENCGNVLRPGNIEYEHLIPDGLGGEPTLENCGVWCRVPCSKSKTFSEDNPRMAKADRVLRKSYGLTSKRQQIKSAGFRKAEPKHSATRPIVRKSDGDNRHV
ncbi:MAG: hypothetical protein J0I08_23465 [Rhizobiales bacterium]|nr:hypothetical protein [Hyphomicrobiales bacterium]